MPLIYTGGGGVSLPHREERYGFTDHRLPGNLTHDGYGSIGSGMPDTTVEPPEGVEGLIH